jgi:hypothetical protein
MGAAIDGCAMIHASETCAGVAPTRPETVSRAPRIFIPRSPSKYFLSPAARGRPSMSAALRYLPERKPLASPKNGMTASPYSSATGCRFASKGARS